MADIFVAYKREERDRVEPVARALEREGFSVWWDPNCRSVRAMPPRFAPS